MNVLLKALVIGGLGIGFVIPLLMVSGVVSERSHYRGQVVADVAQSTAGDQHLLGPLLVVRYQRQIHIPDDETQITEETRILWPDTLAIDARVAVEKRRRGIYEVPVFRSTNHLSAAFHVPERFGINPGFELVGEPRVEVVLGVRDPRGMRSAPVVRVDGAPIQVRPGGGPGWVGQAVSGSVEAAPGRTMKIDADVELVGTDRLLFVPAGGVTIADVRSNWPHPGFVGGYLPDTRKITTDGFEAHWRLSDFATGVQNLPEPVPQQQARPGPGAGQERRIPESSTLGVRFVQPVDVYQQSERAVKYGMLFVLLTFAAFFLYEVLRRMAIHPIQYMLCGAALVLFFLLLISLSEHVPFGAAYLVASAACVGLLAFYVGHVVRNAARGIGFGVLLGALYGFLYVVLRSEDYALLLGTLLLFASLATVMVMTRRVDWYRLQEETAANL